MRVYSRIAELVAHSLPLRKTRKVCMGGGSKNSTLIPYSKKSGKARIFISNLRWNTVKRRQDLFSFPIPCWSSARPIPNNSPWPTPITKFKPLAARNQYLAQCIRLLKFLVSLSLSLVLPHCILNCTAEDLIRLRQALRMICKLGYWSWLYEP